MRQQRNQMQQHDQPAHSLFDLRAGKNLLSVIATAWAMTIRVPMRRACGRNYVGLNIFAGPIWIFLFANFAKAPALLYWIPVFFVGFFVNRITELRMRFKGNHIHTYYGGDPWLGRKLLFLSWKKDEESAKGFELFWSLLIGAIWAVASNSPGVFTYFFLGIFAVAIVEATGKQYRQRRLDAMGDSILEHQFLSGELHKRRKF